MYRLCAVWLFIIPLLAVAVDVSHAEEGEALYDADPQHLWNRLHKTLFVRIGPNRRSYGQDRLEPLLWPKSKHLLEETSHRRAVAVLEEFLSNSGEELIGNPLKRALLQRDLWLVFNWLAADHGDFAKPSLKAEEASAAVERLKATVAKVIGRLALTRQEIARLTDNYAAAVASGKFARRFDRERRDSPYLPPELFADDGPWVCVGRSESDGVTAPQHLRDDYNRFTNSVFFVFLRLPAGRQATLLYLKQLTAFDQPLLVRNPKDAHRRSYPLLPNPKLPQFPDGTQLALVRRALLIDSSNQLTASPITESVQLRVMHGDMEALSNQLRAEPARFFRDVRRQVGSWQTFLEFRLRRLPLFSGRGGGLHAVTANELDFKTGFGAHPWDEFERALRPDQSFLKMTQRPVKDLCFSCHSMPGVYSFNSLKMDLRFAMQRKGGDKEKPLALSAMAVKDVAKATVSWKTRRPQWRLLQTRLAE